jgi:sortase (surface protein transpeptidase)
VRSLLISLAIVVPVIAFSIAAHEGDLSPLPAAEPAATVTVPNETGGPEPVVGERASVSIADISVERATPTRVRIPTIGVDAPIEGVGVRDGEFDVVEDAVTVGWYRYGPTPGQEGSAVLAAHVDTARDGPGVFFELDRLGPGDLVEVDLDDGTSTTFRITVSERHPKEDLASTDVFARSGGPRLSLITCGGAFDPVQRRYAENVVVTAVPIDP